MMTNGVTFMNEQKRVATARRKILRDIKNPLANDFVKYLAEIVLNADDSYKRIEANEPSSTLKTIDIKLNREKREVVVIDRAEGMSAEDLDRIFTVYGADHAKGDAFHHVRGLFGQGASDVLFASATSKQKAKIESIKDGQFARCTFIFKDEKFVKTQQPKVRLQTIRDKYGIEKNGTAVIFDIPQVVRIPKWPQLIKKIETFYMFRYLLNDPYRRITIHEGNKKHTLNAEAYLFNPKRAIIKAKPFAFHHESHHIEGTLTLYDNPKKDEDETHVIIKDERNAVYDNTLFNLEDYPGANRISGEMTIHGLYQILREKLEDLENPMQILTDSRDGFDRRIDFTKTFFKAVKPIVEKAIKQNNERRHAQTVSLSDVKKFVSALKRINDYYEDRLARRIGALTPGIEPPAKGIAFARETIEITEGKTYALQVFINANNIVGPQTTVTFEAESEPYFALSPKSIEVDKAQADEQGLIIKQVRLEASQATEDPITINASMDDLTANAFVNVVEEEVLYPEYGFEFIPSHYRFTPSKHHTLKLYIDLNTFKEATTVSVNFSSKQELLDDYREIPLKQATQYHGNTALLKIPFQTDKDAIHYTVTANALDRTTKARIRVEKPKPKDSGRGGFLSRVELAFEPESTWQTSFNQDDGTLYINAEHVINRTVLGDLRMQDAKKPKFTTRQNTYLFELLAHEAAKRFVFEDTRGKDPTPEKVHDTIQQEKTALYRVLKETL